VHDFIYPFFIFLFIITTPREAI